MRDVPRLCEFYPAIALQLRKKHGKTSVTVRETSVRVRYTYYQNAPTLQNLHTHTHKHSHTHTHTHTHCKTHTHTRPHTHTPTHTHTHTHTHTLAQTLQKPHVHTHTHPHITKQYKTTTVQIKTNTLRGKHWWKSPLLSVVEFQSSRL